MLWVIWVLCCSSCRYVVCYKSVKWLIVTIALHTRYLDIYYLLSCSQLQLNESVARLNFGKVAALLLLLQCCYCCYKKHCSNNHYHSICLLWIKKKQLPRKAETASFKICKIPPTIMLDVINELKTAACTKHCIICIFLVFVYDVA